jgi:tRNA nucleotidyltransferase (CCA-adding enzyme)
VEDARLSGNDESRLQGRVYLVGGAVRDGLLGLPVEERDWVVVGSTPQALRAAGFRQADPKFPVFLHPDTGEEYALARRETKVAGGYRGFVTDVSPAVTLEQDLARRDFTINAMARDAAGELIDPYGGQDDLAEGRLRHVGAAFVEDPVRILRAARFAAKLGAGFRLAHATHRLMRQMVEAGAVAELQPQRIAAEMYKSLAYAQPWRFFEVLHACGALADLAPGLAAQMQAGGAHAAGHPAAPVLALRRACRHSDEVDVRLAALLSGSDDPLPTLSDRLGLARSTLDLLQAARAALPAYLGLAQAGPAAMHGLLQQMRAWHRNGPFTRILAVLRAQVDTEALSRRLLRARAAALQVSASDLQARGLQGAALGEALAQERMHAIAGAL